MTNITQFNTSCHAKCILSGEHAVLHGASAVVVPCKSYTFSLSYIPTQTYQLHADFEGNGGENLLLCFWPALEECLKMLGHSLSEISGKFIMKNTIPIGAGLGFSACMCVAIARWLCHMGWISTEDIFRFAHRCENLFHGKSSGTDVMAVMTNKALIYRQDQQPQFLKYLWQPNLYVSFAKSGAATSKSVATTEHLWRENQQKAKQLCEQMENASQIIINSLTAPNLTNTNRTTQFCNAIEQANHCFEEWGLVQGSLAKHLHSLKNNGAIAAKPTGSGGWGGHVISLWQDSPPKHLQNELIPLFDTHCLTQTDTIPVE